MTQRITTVFRDVMYGARAMAARGLVRMAIWLLPHGHVRDRLEGFADAWRVAVDRGLRHG